MLWPFLLLNKLIKRKNGWAVWMLPSFSRGWWVRNAMYVSLKSAWAALIPIYPLLFPWPWWRGSFVHDFMFGCPTSDSVHRPSKYANVKFMEESQLQHRLLAFPFSSLLDSSGIILADVLSTFPVSQSVLSPVLLLFLSVRETWSAYKYEPRDSFYCKYFKDFFLQWSNFCCFYPK